MAPDVIDLISSSPPPPAEQAGHANGRRDAPVHRSTATATTASTTASANTVLSDDFLFLSDDFDTTIDLDEPILQQPPGNKRRISPSNNSTRPAKRTPPRELPGPSVRTTNARPAAVFDPICLTSSPEPAILPERVISPQPKPRACPQPETCTPAIRTIQSSDPFATSPLTVEQRITTVPESSDAFASSPRPADPAPKPRSARPVYIGETPAPVTKPTRRNGDWDPISSSAPEAFSFGSSPPRTRPVVIDIEDSGPEGSDDELPDIASFDIAQCQRSQLRRSQSDIVSSKSRKTSKPQKSTEDRTREKEAKAAARELDKEKKRREKLDAKEAKAREKDRNAALAEVNKLRTDKKISTPEMIVDMPASLSPTTKVQLETLLEGLDVQYTTWDSPIENVIKWRRKVKSRYNDDLGLWEPLPLRIEDEKHALVILTADEFVKLALADDLESHVGKMVRHLGNHQIIYLLEGMLPWTRKNRNLRNRQFTSHVRSQEPTTQAGRRRTTTAPEYVPEEKIDDALLQLQVMHDVLIHHTTIPLETAQWIAVFTQHVSTVPYRRQRDQATLGAGFCMESGQVRTGDDAKDTYVRMLQEIVRVTAPIAYGIAAEFGNVSDLVCKLEAEGPNRLEGIRKSANKDGAISDRNVGQAVSRRMHKVFTGRDDGSTDV
ncbi:ERCC4 domain-containing protein [Ilyonectria robusta]|uniref:ERCC4 domain-containing protein n=1 Tax=Ilyonectria robusta TaxID=1079257 RepID=UPI001E8E85EE|nr:ERCC4 domain-containing protein [Ilyonectria robusta]KAH8714604.1 ERCC4 domain-containing protein [Ilyonectria robusta]